jgi:hypothetical protein
VATLLPVVQLTQLKSAAKAEFDGVLTPYGWDFEKTQTDFVRVCRALCGGAPALALTHAEPPQVTLVSPGSLTGRSRWLLRARFWRLVLSQTRDGCWDCSDNVAFALQARDATEVAAVPASLLLRLRNVFGVAAEAFDEGDQGAGSNEEAGFDDAVEALTEDLQGGKRRIQRGDADVQTLEPQPGSGVCDDPLACSVDAIAHSLPQRLRAVQREDPHVDVMRVWTTFCCCSMLQDLPVSWIWGDGAACASVHEVSPLAQPAAR